MIDSTTINVKLTLEQLQQLDEFQTRLSNLETENKIATKNLIALKNDTMRITKERDYQTELLDKVNEQLTSAQFQITELNEKSLKVNDVLAVLNKEIEDKKAIQFTKDTELQKREDEVTAKEKQASERHTSLEKKEILHSNDKYIFNSKVAKLKETIKDF